MAYSSELSKFTKILVSANHKGVELENGFHSSTAFDCISIVYFAFYRLIIMVKRCLYFLIVLAMVACEPFDLNKKDFPVCAKPSAGIGYSIGRLDVTFSLDNPQGDIGVVGWDPGDNKGVGRVGTRVTYTYDKPGTYTITMTIANSCDDKFTITRPITVSN
jgi:hypothetical protein